LFSCPENCGIIEHMMKNEDRKSSLSLPLFFKSILWSSNFKNIDPEKAKRTIIIQAINYGDLRHWRWILARYGNEEINKVLGSVPRTEIRVRALRLASLIFGVEAFLHAPRGT